MPDKKNAPPVQTPPTTVVPNNNFAPGSVASRALRGLGFEMGSQVLSTGAPPLQGGGGTPIQTGGVGIGVRKAEMILQSYPKTPEGIATGLRATGSERDPAVREALVQKLGQKLVTKAVLTAMLVSTGRANERTNLPGQLGGERTTEMDARAETSAGVVLRGMESGTRENQKARDAKAPLTHAVSGHGKGTDQVSRLLTGRRADEIAEDRKDKKLPAKTVTLGGNAHGLGPTTVPAYGTIGQDPSNVSGAFTTNQGMLGVVNEAFAQADMVSRFSDDQRHAKGPYGDADGARFVTNVQGPGGEIGYNLEITDKRAQKTGMGLAHDELAKRYQSVQRKGGLQNATVVLDPAYVGGKRAGWNLQTAYAHGGTAGRGFTTPGEVSGTPIAAAARKRTALAGLKTRQNELSEKERNLRSIETSIAKKKEIVDKLTGDIDKLEKANKAVPEKMRKSLEGVKTTHQKETDRKPEAEQAIVLARQAVVDAQREVDLATEEERRTTTSSPRPSGGGGAKVASAGYDPATGLYTGGRPDKPENKTLRGKDEEGDKLTAHHLYPWNRIEVDLNDALRSRSVDKMQKLLAFGEVDVPSWFWTEFAKEPKERGDAFTHEVDRVAQHICWSPTNVFMGPISSKRGDDPHENLDQAYTKSGLVTPSTALADLMAKKGGIGKMSGLTALLARNIRQAQGGETRRYDPSEWKTNTEGKKERKKRVPL